MPLPAVKNLIFDLGGVILDLSVDHTLQSFAQISGIPKEKVIEMYYSTPGFLVYEKGEMDDAAFRKFLKQTYNINASDTELDTTWNAMLRGFPLAKLDLLQKLKEKYKVFLLSNTNNIHLTHMNGVMLPAITGGNSLDIYFHKAYYSHRMFKRKPDAEIFEQVLDENNLQPEQTLFLDDHAPNIEGAKALGIKTALVNTPNFILDYFHE